MRSDGLPRGQEEDNVEMVWGKARQAWCARGETGGVGLQLRLDLRLHLAPAVAKLASQALPASPAARPAPPRGPRGTTHRVDQCMVAHHHHHPPTTTLQLSLTDVWNEVWRRRIQHPPSGAGASWCVRLETSTVLPVHTS